MSRILTSIRIHSCTCSRRCRCRDTVGSVCPANGLACATAAEVEGCCVCGGGQSCAGDEPLYHYGLHCGFNNKNKKT